MSAVSRTFSSTLQHSLRVERPRERSYPWIFDVESGANRLRGTCSKSRGIQCAAAQWLIDNHYSKPSRIAIQGLSNGGLLVTAAITKRPELFVAAIGRCPLIDMIRYERFSIARWWMPEYGSASDAEQFKALFAYSPYHHVRKGMKYPAVLLITGDGDTRVDSAHARKMTAMLQNATASGRPVLLLYDTKSGHSGTLSTGAEVEQTTSELTFLLWQLGSQP